MARVERAIASLHAGAVPLLAPLLTLLAGLLAALCLLGAPAARADCVQSGTDVTCTGTDTDGFPNSPDDRPPVEPGLDITVESGAVVENFVGPGGGTNTIALTEDSTVTIEQGGSVTAEGGAAAITDGASLVGRPSNEVTNAGTIFVTGSGGRGIDLGDGAQVTNEATGRITVNSGGLAGTSVTGIQTGQFSNVVNDGVVDVIGAGAAGIMASGLFGTSVDSSGTVIATGLQSLGISARDITHGGTTRVTGASSTGLRAFGSVLNDGSVEANGDTAVGIEAQGIATVTNPGVVTVTGSDAAGVFLNGGATLGNTGLVDASASDGGIGVVLGGNGAVTVNTGTIRGGSGTGVGVRMTDALGPKTLRNEPGGLIESLSGTAVLGSNVIDTVENRGEIQGDVLLQGGNDLYVWGTDSILTGVLDGGDGLDTLALSQTDPGAPVDGVFDLSAPAGFERLLIGLPDDGGRWTLTGSGSYPDGITLFGGGLRVDSGALQNDLSLEGGTLEIPFDSGGGVATLAVDGDLSLGSGATLALQQIDAGTLSGGLTVRAVLATGSRSGQFGDVRVIGTTSPFLRGIPHYGSQGGIQFVDVRLVSGFEPLGRNKNEARVGAFLDDALAAGPGSADFQAVIDDLTALSNAEAADALDALHGAVYDAHTSTAFATAGRYTDMLARRPLRCEQLVSRWRRDRPSLSPCSPRRLTPWAEGFGQFRDRDGDGEFDDWSSAGGGVAFGLDGRPAAGWMVSALIGTSRSGLDLDDDGDGSYTSFELGFGAGYSWGGTYLRGAAAYGHGWHTTHRTIDYTGISRLALSDYDSDRVSLRAEAGHSFVFAPFEIEPLATLEYIWLGEGSVDESGAGGLGLDIDSRDNHLITTTAGLRAGMTLVKYAWMGSLLEWADGVWRPEIRGAWRQVWIDYDRDLDSRLKGAAPGIGRFRASAEDAQYGGEFGAGVSFQPHGSRNTIALDYEGFLGDGSMDHTVKAVFRMPL